jgi:Methane oxygenase PmoA
VTASKFFLSTVVFCTCIRAASAGVEMKEQPDKVRVEIDGKLFTEYCYQGATHVYFYPLIGPGGVKMTRDWPMQSPPGEAHDHPHQRSLWFAHGSVNGADFWSESASFTGTEKPHPVGAIRHVKFLEVKSGDEQGVIRDQLEWAAPDGSTPLTSVQTLRVYERPETERLFDFEVVLTAGDKDVVMGDTKEGSMALRIAESMRLSHPKDVPGEGHMVNDQGQRDGDVWGKRASWVDYSGPVDGKTVGIAFFDNPQNPRHPTRWHARDYGLFAANPFCEHQMDPTKPEGAGDFKIPAGQSATFRYRILLHEGDAAQAKVADRYAEYIKQ